jgi:hypothetical protein
MSPGQRTKGRRRGGGDLAMPGGVALPAARERGSVSGFSYRLLQRSKGEDVRSELQEEAGGAQPSPERLVNTRIRRSHPPELSALYSVLWIA